MQQDNSGNFLLYAASVILTFVFLFYFFRWVFAVNKHLQNQEKQINLLTKIAEKSGVSADELMIIKTMHQNRS